VAAFLSQAAEFTNAARFGLAAELAAEASRYVSPIPAVDAETFLAGVAAVRRDRDFSALMLERERLRELKPILASLPHGFPDR